MYAGQFWQAQRRLHWHRRGHDAILPPTIREWTLAGVGSVLWGEGDSDVAFHDSEIFMINSGVMYRFGAR